MRQHVKTQKLGLGLILRWSLKPTEVIKQDEEKGKPAGSLLNVCFAFHVVFES